MYVAVSPHSAPSILNLPLPLPLPPLLQTCQLGICFGWIPGTSALSTRTQPLSCRMTWKSKQLSFQVILQLSGWVRVLKAEVPGIQPKQIPSWHVWRRGGRGRGRLKNGRGRVRWYSYIHPKIETQKLKYPEAVCLFSFCGRQSEKHAHTVLQIWQTRWRVNCYFSKEISTHLSQNHVKMW